MKRDLRFLIEAYGHLATPIKEMEIDFEKLSEKLKSKYHINLESRSLHKLFAIMKSAEKPKKKTLDRLSLFAGFQNWDELQNAFMGK